MPHLETYINIDGPPTKQSTQFNSIEILRVNASGVKYKVPSLDFGLKMRTPTVTRNKRWRLTNIVVIKKKLNVYPTDIISTDQLHEMISSVHMS